ncbi:MAG: hypothetical protein LBM59_07135 [Ruminococcus sp.]|nr:hypothetical protein [Ruminococcus sp.]
MNITEKVFTNIYTTALDTVAAAKRAEKSGDAIDQIEINIMKYILAGERTILTLPQACDNDTLINIAVRPNASGFLLLAKLGLFKVTTYGSYNSISEYAVDKMRNPNFTFSNSLSKN